MLCGSSQSAIVTQIYFKEIYGYIEDGRNSGTANPEVD
jgi:hypothetical protein